MITDKEKRNHIIISFIALSAASLFLCAFFALLFAEPYPTDDQLVYEECTFVKYEQRKSRAGKTYYVSVKEYAGWLKIDNIVSSSASEERLKSLENGDKIKVSIRKTENGNDLYYMSSGQNSVLTYEDYLEEHRRNKNAGYIACSMFSFICIALFTAEKVYYKKHGFCLPLGQK